jgi:MFS transporter, DHA2 family, multidrug resistance protein
MLTSNISTNHAELSEKITQFSDRLVNAGIDPMSLVTATGLQTAAQVNAMVTAQSMMIAYVDDFRLMFYITLCAAPLLLLLRYKRQALGAGHGGRPAVAMAD